MNDKSEFGTRTASRSIILLLAAFTVLALAPSADAFIYSSDGDWIRRANLDGTVGEESLFLHPEADGGARDLAVNGNHIYWVAVESSSHGVEAIGRASLDPLPDIEYGLVSFPSPSPGVEGVAVDGRHIYWTAQLSESIGRANLDGTGVDNNFISLDPGNPDGKIRDNAVSVAVDGGHIYWTKAGNDFSEPGGIGRAKLDGSGIDPNFIVAGPGRYPLYLAVDAGHIYWTEFERFVGNTIGRANLDGGGVNPNFISIPALGEALAVDAGHIYWTQGGAIGRANLDGTGVKGSFIPQSALGGYAWGLAVDSRTEGPVENKFSFGKVKRSKRNGTAKLTVRVPQAGNLLLEGKDIKHEVEEASGAGDVKLLVQAKGRSKRKLSRKGKVKVKAEVTFSPEDGTDEATATKTIKLVWSRRPQH